MAEKKARSNGGGTAYVNVDFCKGCGICVEFCPPVALEMSKGFNAKGYHTPVLSHPELCTGCDLCGVYCPDFAIFGRRLEAAKKP